MRGELTDVLTVSFRHIVWHIGVTTDRRRRRDLTEDAVAVLCDVDSMFIIDDVESQPLMYVCMHMYKYLYRSPQSTYTVLLTNVLLVGYSTYYFPLSAQQQQQQQLQRQVQVQLLAPVDTNSN
jgi:hypothetical protein